MAVNKFKRWVGSQVITDAQDWDLFNFTGVLGILHNFNATCELGIGSYILYRIHMSKTCSVILNFI